MSSDDESSSESVEWNYMDSDDYDEEEEKALSEEDIRLFDAVWNNHANAAEAAQQALRDGANVNAVRRNYSPLMLACYRGNDQVVGFLLDAGADARWRDLHGCSALTEACREGHLSTVQLLINNDSGILESRDGWQTPLIAAIRERNFAIFRFLLDSGADPHGVDGYGATALIHACMFGSFETVQLLLVAGVDVEGRDKFHRTALQCAAFYGRIEVARELILQHNANMFTVNRDGRTPFDMACISRRSNAAIDPLLEIYGNKLTQDHGRLALHELLKVAEYSFAEDEGFRPPLNPLQIILPLGNLTLKQLRTLLHNLDPELIRTQDDTGKVPIHIACQTNAPVEVLTLILELDPTVLHIADSTGALPVHFLCGTTAAIEYASVRHLVEQGGVGTLAARNQLGASPLHTLCGSRNPSLRTFQYLMQSFPGSVAMRTNAGNYPFMMAAAADKSSASLSVIYELVRANPGLVVPR